MIKIISNQHNFRRAGLAHPKGATEYPDDRFSEEELELLEAEPMLSVYRIPDPEPEKGKAKDKK